MEMVNNSNRYLIDKVFTALYLASVFFMSLRSVLGLSQIDQPTFVVFTYLSYGCLIIKVICTKYTVRELMLPGVGLLVAVAMYIVVGTTLLFGVILFIVGSKLVDSKKIIVLAMAGLISGTVIVISSAILGKSELVLASGVVLGFLNPNGVQSFLSMISVYYLGIRSKRLTAAELFITFSINVVLTLITGSRTGTLITIFVMLLVLALKGPGGTQRRIPVEKVYIVMVLFALFCTVFSNLPGVTQLNNLLSGRFHQANYYLNQYGIALFGNKIAELEAGYEYWHYVLDCGYARLFINFGLIYGMAFVRAHYCVLKQAEKQHDYFTIIILMGMAVQLVTENGGLNINFNMSLILLRPWLMREIQTRKTIFKLRT